ncbi:hypothetical protein INR49_027515 [Caranx melampygus]|nr:hypothetical protein INR49_027515 [Caranx melampygus]
MEALREQYSLDMATLRKTMEQVTQEREARQQANKSRSETEEFESELKDLQNSLLSMKKQMPDDNQSLAEGELDEKSEALQGLKKASGEKEAELLTEISRLKEQSQKDKAELEKALEKAKETAVDHGANIELQEANTRLRERLARMTRLHSSVNRSSEAEEAVEALEDENRSLKSQLEEAKRGATRLSKERDELTRRLEERELEREALRRGKSDLEEQKRLLDRALEKINKEMEMMMGDSRQSVSRLKKELLVCSEERDSIQLERDLLSNRLKHLESELDTEKSTHTDRTREIRGLEDKIKALEIELDEERSSVELLNDRITRSRDQVDQLRSELMQERSARHDLEMDKSVLERQVKELKSRVADMEGQKKASIQASQRRGERKLKELNATLDQERSQHVEQRDQLSLRVKALKRQVDESEGEVERLEGVRRKILRDLEEQQELQEALQAKVTALEGELKRKSHHTSRTALGSTTLSSEDEDGFYDTNITSILNESHLQTTSS